MTDADALLRRWDSVMMTSYFDLKKSGRVEPFEDG